MSPNSNSEYSGKYISKYRYRQIKIMDIAAKRFQNIDVAKFKHQNWRYLCFEAHLQPVCSIFTKKY
jgi:hypothetical protein